MPRNRTVLLGGQNDVSTSVQSGGTTNTIPKFTSAYTIGDSTITDNGTAVVTTLPIQAVGLQTGTGVATTDIPFSSIGSNAGPRTIEFLNTSSATSAFARILIGNATGSNASLEMGANGTGFTNSGLQRQDGGYILTGSALSGQFNIGTIAAAILGFATNNTVRATFDTIGNFLLNAAAAGTSAVGVMGFGNGTVPSTSPADMIQIFSVDASAGNATIGLRTEAAVVTEAVVSDRTLQVVINGTVYKFCLKV